ncbi:hypothetical protein [Shimia ponticola]|uniref:hypothetical protein n=1 Tax=Shimia ponticola TaxID=2582893 RepID=UPI0011BE8174|nr:hypothetical protein [Shimia ponticola]
MTTLVTTFRQRPYVILGVITLALAVLGLSQMTRGWLTPLQVSFWWQTLTGTALLAAILYQWVVFFQRLTGNTTRARGHYLAHRWVGVGATLLFALHAVRLGHTWMSALAVLFILVALTGLLNREVVRYPRQWMYMAWLAMHTMLSAMMVTLMVVHIWVALAYE